MQLAWLFPLCTALLSPLLVTGDCIAFAAKGQIGYNLLMLGPPGSGKTMLSKRVPEHSYRRCYPSESIETTRIYSPWGDWRRGNR